METPESQKGPHKSECRHKHTPTPKMSSRKKALFPKQYETIIETPRTESQSSDETTDLGRLSLLSDDENTPKKSKNVQMMMRSCSFFTQSRIFASIDSTSEDEPNTNHSQTNDQLPCTAADKENQCTSFTTQTNLQLQMEQMKTPNNFTIPATLFYSNSANDDTSKIVQRWTQHQVARRPPPTHRHRKKRLRSSTILGRNVSHGIRKPRKSLSKSFQLTTRNKNQENNNEATIPSATLKSAALSPVNTSPIQVCKTDGEISSDYTDSSDTESLPDQRTTPFSVAPELTTLNSEPTDGKGPKFFKSKTLRNANYWVTDTISATLKRGRGLEMVEHEATPKLKRRKKSASNRRWSNIHTKVDTIIQCLDENPQPPTASESPNKCVTDVPVIDQTSSPTTQLRKLTSSLALESPKNKYFPLFTRRRVQATTFASALKSNNICRSSGNWRPQASNQLQIDAGQKAFGARQCPQCELVYSVHEPEEELIHETYHNSVGTLRFTGWTEEHVLFSVHSWGAGGRIILVNSQDSHAKQRRLQDLMQFVDKELGSSVTKFGEKTLTFLAIARKVVVGICVAEPLQLANKLTYVNGQDCRTLEQYPVRCGISKIWVAPLNRRHGVGKQLFLAVRNNFFFGYQMRNDEIAFSSPTPAGREFASRVTGLKEFYVYVE